ncbi:sirohydrochlorin cobaltochelatase [Balneicella halophila]|uniref:Sirohydrochlorin cobaltochelatase n=1 Tax=Balneicella halophila TaxID=1537566 RepID=A0A7L4UT04_BALHA|nr:sirohydrochlorin chelatase [Balneicella halophila]PVX52164.1 sirohydrochlorin cobaltochelatase [Balneicella halophila]
MEKKGIMLCGHGTRLKTGVEAFNQFAEEFQNQIDGYETTSAFMEFAQPDFEAGVKKLADKGIKEIIALPLFLFTGVHTEKDIPCMLYQLGKKYDVSIKLGNYMGVCEEMVTVCENLIREAAPEEFINDIGSTTLVIAGVGSSRVKANADLASITRYVQERFRFPSATVGYLSRMTFPPIQEVIDDVCLLPYKNIIVLPYFFFDGIYMRRAKVAMERGQQSHPEKNFVFTDLLASENTLFELLKKRLNEVISGKVDAIQDIPKEELENYHGHHHHHGHGHHHDHSHHHHHGHDNHHSEECNHKKDN